MKKLIALIIVVIVLGVGAIIGYPHYKAYSFRDEPINVNTEASIVVQVPSGLKLNELGEVFEKEGVIEDAQKFNFLSDYKEWGELEVPFNRIRIEPEWATYNDLLNGTKYAIDNYMPTINVVISNVRRVEAIAGKVSHFLKADSLTITELFTSDSVIAHYGFSQETWSTFFLPNTYECYVDITPEEFLQKLAEEYKAFWNSDRQLKASALGLTQSEVTILASIVYEEQKRKFDEQPKIAGVYINRLKKDIKLDADPTVKFAWGDPTIKRLLYKHLEIESPYNTYKHKGLPPGPISIPEPRTIDAVLNYEVHDYIFFCAKPGYDGYHSFAETNAQHEVNAKIYHKWLNEEGIK